jgi:hypothetical protein
MIAKNLMKNPSIGWIYQGVRPIEHPVEWDSQTDPIYRNAQNSSPYDPVTGMTWFEANAFSHWLGVDFPTYPQIEAHLAIHGLLPQLSSSDQPCKMYSAVSEWTLSGTGASGIGCGSCSEMGLLETYSTPTPYVTKSYKCPLFRSRFLGFHVVANGQ